MKTLLQLIDITYANSHETLFEGLTLNIRQNEKTGLVGQNGCGKSTLLSLIGGQLALDKGEVRKSRSCQVAIVEQFVPESLDKYSLIEAVTQVLPDNERFSRGWEAEANLIQLGFQQSQLATPVSGLSGGQQNLMLIARAIVSKPDLLLMDEPGNHMDIEAMTKLQNFLSQKSCCPFLIVSHDQHLLNTVCEKTVFLRDKKTYSFELSYDAACEQLNELDKAAEKRRQNEEKEIDRLQKTAKRLAIWGRENDNEDLSRKAKSIQKRVDRLTQQKTQTHQQTQLNISLANHSLPAKQVLAIEDYEIKLDGQDAPLLSIEKLIVRPGDRIALLGVNGVGKSTTLREINQLYHSQEDHPINAKVRFNPRASLAYYDQDLVELNHEANRFDWLRTNSHADEVTIKKELIKAGVTFDQFDRKVSHISGGEKARMMFLLFSLNKPNFLILDEPTNHIDLEGKQQLVEQLMNSDATMLLTSHDRYFLEQVANRWFILHHGKLQEINQSEEFYQSLALNKSASKLIKPDFILPEKRLDTEEKILSKIEHLEKLLRDDQMRKLKFQKEHLQQEWQTEIDKLWNTLS